jgi:hypothetical protein
MTQNATEIIVRLGQPLAATTVLIDATTHLKHPLSGTLEGQIRHHTSQTVVATATVANTRLIITDASEFRLDWNVPAAALTGLKEGFGTFDVFNLTTGQTVTSIPLRIIAGAAPSLDAEGHAVTVEANKVICVVRGINAQTLAGASYLVAAFEPGLTNQRILTSSNSVIWDLSTPGQVRADINKYTTDVLGNIGFGSGILGSWSASIVTGTNNLALGNQAAGALTSGSNNIAIGLAAMRANSNGSSNVNIGALSGFQNNGSENTCVGIGSGQQGLTVDRVTALGFRALYNNLSDENVGVGHTSAGNLTTGLRATAVGVSAGILQTTQNDLTALGYNAGGGAHVPGDNQTLLGASSYATKPNQIVLGSDTVSSVKFFGTEYAVKGYYRDLIISGGSNYPTVDQGAARTIFGFEAALNLLNVNSFGVLAAGTHAMMVGTKMQNSVALGVQAGQFGNNWNDVTAVGSQALRNLGRHIPVYDVPADEVHIKSAGLDATQGKSLPLFMVGHVAVGKNALRYNTIGFSNTGIGDSALGFTTTGEANVALGYVCGEGNVIGSFNSYGGQGVRQYIRDGDSNALWGYGIQVGVGASGTYPAGGSRNAVVGSDAIRNWNGSDMAAVGFEAFKNATGHAHGDVGLGCRVGNSIITGGDNIFIGVDSGNHASQATAVQNSIAIGADTFTTANNQIRIGNAANNNFYFGVTNFSASQLVALKALVAAA